MRPLVTRAMPPKCTATPPPPGGLRGRLKLRAGGVHPAACRRPSCSGSSWARPWLRTPWGAPASEPTAALTPEGSLGLPARLPEPHPRVSALSGSSHVAAWRPLSTAQRVLGRAPSDLPLGYPEGVGASAQWCCCCSVRRGCGCRVSAPRGKSRLQTGRLGAGAGERRGWQRGSSAGVPPSPCRALAPP